MREFNQDGGSDELRDEEPKVLSFTEHLEELRWRILKSLGFFVTAFVVSFFFAPRVISILIAPLTRIEVPRESDEVLHLEIRPDATVAVRALSHQDIPVSSSLASHKPSPTIRAIVIHDGQGQRWVPIGAKSRSSLYYLSPIEPFTLLVKGALLLSALLAIPMAIYQVWQFVAPGLLPNEKRVILPVILASLILFPLGASFAYVVSHTMLRILLSFSDYIPGLEANIVASHYLNFMLTLMLGFGLVFEFPLVLILLARLGVIDAQFLAQRRKYAILVIAVLAAVVTPTPDALNMLVMMAPLVVLYEVSIWIIRFVQPRRGVSPRWRWE